MHVYLYKKQDSKNSLDIHWRRKWSGNLMENLAYGNGVVLHVPEENNQAHEYAVIIVLSVTTKARDRKIRLMTKYEFETF